MAFLINTKFISGSDSATDPLVISEEAFEKGYEKDEFNLFIHKQWELFSTKRKLDFEIKNYFKENRIYFYSAQKIQSELNHNNASESYSQYSFLSFLNKTQFTEEFKKSIRSFAFFATENILQHADKEGIFLFRKLPEQRCIEFTVFDAGPGITDANGDGIPDITYVVKEGNTLEPNPNNGIGLTISIRNMDQLVLFTNGYKWRKSHTDIIEKANEYVRGVKIIARKYYTDHPFEGTEFEAYSKTDKVIPFDRHLPDNYD